MAQAMATRQQQRGRRRSVGVTVKAAEKRAMVVAYTKLSPEYTNRHPACRQHTPDPNDPSIPKREWERRMRDWRATLRTNQEPMYILANRMEAEDFITRS